MDYGQLGFEEGRAQDLALACKKVSNDPVGCSPSRNSKLALKLSAIQI